MTIFEIRTLPKIPAIEKEIQGVKEEDYKLHLKAEALKAWELYQKGMIPYPDLQDYLIINFRKV